MSRHLVFAAILAGIVFAAFEAGRRATVLYERIVAAKIQAAFDVLGHDWARVRVDGLRLELRGHAPDQASRALAVEAVRRAAPFAHLTTLATATLARAGAREPVRIEILRDRTGFTLTGQSASAAMRAAIGGRLAADGAARPVRDLTGIQAAAPPGGMDAEIAIASLAAVTLPNAHVVLEPRHVAIGGQAQTRRARRRLTLALQALAGRRVRLTLGITIPAPLIAPFSFVAEREVGAPLRIERCAVRSETEQIVMRKRLRTLGVGEHREPCRIGIGGPGGDWTGALRAGLDALGKLRAGRLEIAYRTVRLTGHPPATAPEFADIARALRLALPDGYVAEAVLQPLDAASRVELAREQAWLNLARTGHGVTIAGHVPDARMEKLLLAHARTVFGAGRVSHALQRTGQPVPRNWQIAAMALIDQLALSAAGEAGLAGRRLSLRASVGSPALARQIHRELQGGLPGYTVRSDLKIDLPAQARAIRFPALRCAAELNAVLRNGAIAFDTSSARISGESGAVISRLARKFAACDAAPVEIGGHTDSQGRAAFNEALSQARAEAVARALIERGVAAGRLRARGYGETRPVASNETEAGRARNRRIEFRPAASR